MRLMLLLVGIVSTWAVGVTRGVFPLPTQLAQAILALGANHAQGAPGSANLVNTYNGPLPEILRGHTPEELGLHVAPVTIPPGSFRTMSNGAANAATISQSGFASGLLSEVQQNNARMQDITTYGRNPAAWHGAPPH